MPHYSAGGYKRGNGRSTEAVGAILVPTELDILETKALPLIWFARLPGNEKIIRGLKLPNPRIAAFWAFHYSSVGQPASPFGNQPAF